MFFVVARSLLDDEAILFFNTGITSLTATLSLHFVQGYGWLRCAMIRIVRLLRPFRAHKDNFVKSPKHNSGKNINDTSMGGRVPLWRSTRNSASLLPPKHGGFFPHAPSAVGFVRFLGLFPTMQSRSVASPRLFLLPAVAPPLTDCYPLGVREHLPHAPSVG